MRFLLLLLALGSSALAAPPPGLVQTVTHPHVRRAFAVDARQAVAVDPDGAAAVLLPRPGSPRTVKVAGNGKLRSPLITPQGRLLAVGLDFGRCEVMVWDLTAGRAVTRLRGNFRPVLRCGQDTEFVFNPQFTPDGRFLLTQDETGLRRWDARSGKPLKARPGTFLTLSVSPDGRRVAALSQNRRVEVWDSGLSRRLKATPQQPADCFRGAGIWPSGMTWSPDSTRLAFSCDREVRVWNVSAGGLHSLRRGGRREAPEAPIFSPDGRFVAANEHQFGVAVWRTQSGRRLVQVKMPARDVQASDIAVGAGNFLFVARTDGRVARYDLERQGRHLDTRAAFPRNPRLWPSLAVSPQWGWLAVASGEGRLNIYRLPRN